MNKLKKIRVLTIDRSKWRTGDDYNCKTGHGATQLLNDEGYMCCLGFYSAALGIPKESLLGQDTPSDLRLGILLPNLTCTDPFSLTDCVINTSFTRTAMNLNDCMVSSQEEREENIRKHFEGIGIKVVFKGKYKKVEQEEVEW